MAESFISIERMREVASLAKTEFPLRVQRFARHTPLDAHAKTSIPAQMMQIFEILPYLATDKAGVPVENVQELVDTFTRKSFSPHHQALAHELAEWACGQLKITFKGRQHGRVSHGEREILEKLARYTDHAKSAHYNGASLPTPEKLQEVCSSVGKRLLQLSHYPNPYTLREEEREIFNREIMDFMLAKPHVLGEKKYGHLEKAKAMIANDVQVTSLDEKYAPVFLRHSQEVQKAHAYRTNIGGVTGENLTNAYYYMRGCAGGENYQNAVNALFKHLAEELDKTLTFPERSK